MSDQNLKQASAVLYCPRCGRHQRPYIRKEGGMWMHLQCKSCGCKFDYKTLTDEEKRARNAARSRSYAKEHPEKVREYNRKSKAKNPEKYREIDRQSQHRRMDRIVAYQREWRKRNPEKYREQKRRYRAKHKLEIKQRRLFKLREQREKEAACPQE